MEKALEEKKKQEALRAQEESELSPEVKEVLEKGRNYLDRTEKKQRCHSGGGNFCQRSLKWKKSWIRIFQRAKARSG